MTTSQQTAIITSIQTYHLLSNRTINKKVEPKSIGPPIANPGIYQYEANTLLAGTMMVTLSLFIVGFCIFLHRKIKPNLGGVPLHALPWTDENLEIYTLSGQEEISGIYLPASPSPPPTYETIIKMCKKDKETSNKAQEIFHPKIPPNMSEDDNLPTYEDAIKLREDNYI